MVLYEYIYMTNWKDAFIVSKIISHTLFLYWVFRVNLLFKISFCLTTSLASKTVFPLEFSFFKNDPQGMLLDRAVENNTVYYITCFIWKWKKNHEIRATSHWMKANKKKCNVSFFLLTCTVYMLQGVSCFKSFSKYRIPQDHGQMFDLTIQRYANICICILLQHPSQLWSYK